MPSSERRLTRDSAISLFSGIRSSLHQVLATNTAASLAERKGQLELIIAKGVAAQAQIPLQTLPDWNPSPYLLNESEIARLKNNVAHYDGKCATILRLLQDDEYWLLNGIESPSTSPPMRLNMAPDPRKVFVVHGRNRTARNGLFDFLRALGLVPLEWEEMVALTGKASPYIGEVLDAGFANTQAVIVLLTGDDEARLRKDLQGSKEPPYEIELTSQARPNVLFEAGMALGKNSEKTIILEQSGLRPFSDLAGRHIIRLSTGSAEERMAVITRLKAASCSITDHGRVDYITGNYFDWLQ